MHVIWKRPDGFHGASPSDFKVIEIGGQSRIWLHTTEKKWFPFQVAGGWQEAEATSRINLLVNLIGRSNEEWLEHLINGYHHTMAESAESYLKDLLLWLSNLKMHLKGDKWETEIMNNTISEIENKLNEIKASFLQQASA